MRDSVSETLDRSSYRPWVFLLTVGLQDTGPLLFKDTRLTFEYVLDAEGERPGIMKEQLINAMLWKRGPRITSKLLFPPPFWYQVPNPAS